jgi:hypothetical protein
LLVLLPALHAGDRSHSILLTHGAISRHRRRSSRDLPPGRQGFAQAAPNQLKDADIHWVILGHSERRSLFGDTDKLVADKTKAAIAAGLSVIACIGESLEEREKGVTNQVVERQLEAIAAAIQPDDWK